METNYRIAYDKGWQELKARTPSEVAIRRRVHFDEVKQRFAVKFFNDEYRLDWEQETVRRTSDGQDAEIISAIIILNYLSFSDSCPEVRGSWVSLKEIPNGGALFFPAFRNNSIDVLIHTFGKSPDLLLRCGAMMGGVPAPMGSISMVFQALPMIPICVVLWEGDEEVSANATILYQPSVSELLHIESLIGLGMYLADQLKKLADEQMASTS
jgi:hypothetical protein